MKKIEGSLVDNKWQIVVEEAKNILPYNGGIVASFGGFTESVQANQIDYL